jgi:hypothetical protein
MISAEATRATLSLLDEIAEVADSAGRVRLPLPRAAEVLHLMMAQRHDQPTAGNAALDAFEIGSVAMLAGNTDAPGLLLSELQPPPADWCTEVLSVTATAWLRLASGDHEAQMAAAEAHTSLAERQKTQELPFLDAAHNPREAALRLAAAYFLSVAVKQAASGDAAEAAETLDRAMRFADHASVTLWAAANWMKAAVTSAPAVEPPSLSSAGPSATSSGHRAWTSPTTTLLP